MRVLLPTLPQPPDQVIQNLTIGDTQLGPLFAPWQDYGVNWNGENCLQGEWWTSRIPEIPVPRAMIGWNPYTPWPDQIGPMAIQGGMVGMVPIGPPPTIPVQIDPVIAALYSQVPQDSNGEMYGLYEILPSQQAPEFDVVQMAPSIAAPTPVLNLRGEVKNSGLLKVMTSANLPATFGLNVYPSPTSYQAFTLTGTTTDGTGAALGNCRVVAYQTGWQYVGNPPVVIAETVSDGSGAFSLLLRNIDYQLSAYKAGSPDLAGITKNTVTPVAATTIYLRDPTVPNSGGGGTRIYGIIS